MLNFLTYISFAICLAAGGFLTADCVSSEKRGGTLGLLFLTPLKSIDIVLGKLVCHGLQLFYGVCAMFPVFFLPLLTDGVTWAEVSRIVLALSLALLLAGCVGILVSTMGTESRQTLMATFTVLTLLAAVPPVWLLIRVSFLRLGVPRFGLTALSPLHLVLCGFDSYYRTVDGPFRFWGSVATTTSLCLATTVLASFTLSRCFRSTDAPVGSRGRQVRLLSSNPVLDLNPYEWITLRGAGKSFSFGVLTYSLVAFFAAMLAVSLVTSHWREGFISAFFTALAIHLVTKLRFAIEATRKICADRQNGALELIFATALSDANIQEGHQNALAAISRGPVCLLIILNLLLELAVVFAPQQLHMESEAFLLFTIVFLGGMGLAAADIAALRWLALLKGLKANTHVRAALTALCILLGPAWVVMALIMAMADGWRLSAHGMAALICGWIAGCLFYDWVLVQYARATLTGAMRRIVSEGS